MAYNPIGLTMPDMVVKRAIERGISILKNNKNAFDEVFNIYLNPEFAPVYGQAYVDKIYAWLQATKIPVVFGFNDNVDKVPSYTIHLAPEKEIESLAAFDDFYGEDADGDIGVGNFSVNIDIGCHADKAGDYVIWLYHMAQYSLFQLKGFMDGMGLHNVTFGAQAQKREVKYASENIWGRWINMQALVTQSWHKSFVTGFIEGVSTTVYGEIDQETNFEI